ncbi:hypothetical protein ABH935_002511 [Catenulispora sp. GAS73]|uniref:hypothetical protein n=1 Tax=Catenulispora sp. GAS73 TaxID=3156269 RepID=UPI003519573E
MTLSPLFLAFGSVLLPLKAVAMAMKLLSLAATFGVLVDPVRGGGWWSRSRWTPRLFASCWCRRSCDF